MIVFCELSGEEGYPGNANIQVSYVLTNHNEILVQYSANADKSTLMNLSTNFYLNLDGMEVSENRSSGTVRAERD